MVAEERVSAVNGCLNPHFAPLLLLVVNVAATYLCTLCCCCRGSRFEDEAELEAFSREFVRSELMESYSVCTQSTLQSAFGPELLAMEQRRCCPMNVWVLMPCPNTLCRERGSVHEAEGATVSPSK